MLSLSRREGESITIGNEISVRVHSVKGNRVRLAIEAPRDVTICRSELFREFTNAPDSGPPIGAIDDGSTLLVASDAEEVNQEAYLCSGISS